jgi:hypothetical protein
VDSILQPANSGNPKAAIGSPKFTMTFGPFYKTELFLGAGMGYHSNDARGVTATQVAGDPATPQDTAPFLVRARGAEIGVRTKVIPNLDSSIRLFYLHQDSELVFEGDIGTTAPGPPSLRTGIEIANNYKPAPWVRIDADLALSRARLRLDSAQEQLFDRWLPLALRLIISFPKPVGGGISRYHLRRKDRLVQCTAVALHQLAATH